MAKGLVALLVGKMPMVTRAIGMKEILVAALVMDMQPITIVVSALYQHHQHQGHHILYHQSRRHIHYHPAQIMQIPKMRMALLVGKMPMVTRAIGMKIVLIIARTLETSGLVAWALLSK